MRLNFRICCFSSYQQKKFTDFFLIYSWRAFENFYADAYVAAKAAIILLTKSWALEYAKNNIRVNCVCAAVVDTDMTSKLWLNTKAKRKITSAEHPLGRLGKPTDVANAVLYFASDNSSWTTGAILPVDGGVSIK